MSENDKHSLSLVQPPFLRTSETAHWFPHSLILTSDVFLGQFFCSGWTGRSGSGKMNEIGGSEGLQKHQWWCAGLHRVDLSATTAVIGRPSIYSMRMCLLLQTVPVSCEGCSLTFYWVPMASPPFLFSIQLDVFSWERKVTPCSEEYHRDVMSTWFGHGVGVNQRWHLCKEY